MNVPIDACENGNAAFTLRVGYDGKCYPGNLGTGGALPSNGRVRGVSTRRAGVRVRSLRTTTRRVRATSSARRSRRRKQPRS